MRLVGAFREERMELRDLLSRQLDLPNLVPPRARPDGNDQTLPGARPNAVKTIALAVVELDDAPILSRHDSEDRRRDREEMLSPERFVSTFGTRGKGVRSTS